jgi:histidine triad (HIT) family protein
MSERTIFEQIIDGDIPADIVHETDEVAAFLDANPLAPGHTLVVPKEPYARLRETPPGLSSAIFDAVRTLTPAIEDAVGADATTVAINDGPEAGQEVPHLHVHIVPRFDGDSGGPLHALFGSTGSADGNKEIAGEITALLE